MTTPHHAKLLLNGDGTTRLPLRCPACARLNPAGAFYCYHDGKPLHPELRPNPVNVGNVPFPAPFCFSDGQTCTNFNQLAVACHSHWEESKTLLADGIWAVYLGAMGRLDLAAAARQAAQNPDTDRGLSEFLAKLPADAEFLRRPQPAFECGAVNLGQLMPKVDVLFQVAVRNEGMLLLHGVCSATCDWLLFGDWVASAGTSSVRVTAYDPRLDGERAWAPEKRFQTRTGGTIPVRVVGDKLRAGLKPLTAEIILDTNGGMIALPVQAHVPIRPFPRGAHANNVLAGVVSPRELAVKARQHPREAGLLFEQGAIKAWYASNGWTYPIEGRDGSGVAAVQQFFEVLGLTQPPRLEIDHDSLTFTGKIGERLTALIRVCTPDGKPVYAHAWSDQEWLHIGPIKYRGTKVKIPLEIIIPDQAEEVLHAQLTIQGNGEQCFVVPVAVVVRR
ncbi:MAG: hypothetical protein ACK4RK_03960 [Gemmataceae bacterium]